MIWTFLIGFGVGMLAHELFDSWERREIEKMESEFRTMNRTFRP